MTATLMLSFLHEQNQHLIIGYIVSSNTVSRFEKLSGWGGGAGPSHSLHPQSKIILLVAYVKNRAPPKFKVSAFLSGLI